MWTPEKITALVLAISTLLGLVGAGAKYLIDRHDKRVAMSKPAEIPVGMAVTDDFADDAIEAWKGRALAAEAALSEARSEIRDLRAQTNNAPPYGGEEN